MYETPNENHETHGQYQEPDVVHEGELEVQAGSPVGLPVWDEALEEW
ncbi:MAG: hypothetical protein JXA14_02775 [Anaerolineae bacterium]|nr:hypothetical protein [Anaerolineae bacterium]